MIDNCLTHKLSNSSQSPSSLDLLSDPNLENPKIFHLKQQKASQQKNWSMFVILPWKSYWNNLLIVKKVADLMFCRSPDGFIKCCWHLLCFFKPSNPKNSVYNHITQRKAADILKNIWKEKTRGCFAFCPKNSWSFIKIIVNQLFISHLIISLTNRCCSEDLMTTTFPRIKKTTFIVIAFYKM